MNPHYFLYSARPALVTRGTSPAPPPSSSLSSRSFRSFRSRPRSDLDDARVTVVSAPPRVKEESESDVVTTTTAPMTTATETTEASITSTTGREVSTASDLWSVSAPPKITSHNSSVVKSETKDKDKRNSPFDNDAPSSDNQIEWVFFEDFEGPDFSEKSQPLRVLTFEAENDTSAVTMDQYFDDTETADVSMLTLPVSITICALCLGNAGSQSAILSGLYFILFKIMRTFVPSQVILAVWGP